MENCVLELHRLRPLAVDNDSGRAWGEVATEKASIFCPTAARRHLSNKSSASTRSKAPEMSLRKTPIFLPAQSAKIHVASSNVRRLPHVFGRSVRSTLLLFNISKVVKNDAHTAAKCKVLKSKGRFSRKRLERPILTMKHPIPYR